MNDLIERVVGAGFQFDVSGPTPRLIPLRPDSRMAPALLEEVRVNRGELLAFLSASGREPESEGERCLKCKEPLGPKGQCWTCHDRPCVTCGTMTSSAFLSLCVACGVKEDRAEEARRRGTTSPTPTSSSPTPSGTVARTT